MDMKKQTECAEAYYFYLKRYGFENYLWDVNYTELSDILICKLYKDVEKLNCDGLCEWYNGKCRRKFAPTALKRIQFLKELGRV